MQAGILQESLQKLPIGLDMKRKIDRHMRNLLDEFLHGRYFIIVGVVCVRKNDKKFALSHLP